MIILSPTSEVQTEEEELNNEDPYVSLLRSLAAAHTMIVKLNDPNSAMCHPNGGSALEAFYFIMGYLSLL